MKHTDLSPNVPGGGITVTVLEASDTVATMTTLYRLFDKAGVLLYVGIAGNPGRRFQQHRGAKLWWGMVARITVEHFETRELAAKAEICAIQTEAPAHNISGRVEGRPSATRLPAIKAEPGPDDGWGVYPAGTKWRFRGRRGDLERTEELVLYWEVDGSSITDDYYSDEIDAYDLWRTWAQRRDTDLVPILWYVKPAEGRRTFESAPHQIEHWPELAPSENFLSFFTPPTHAVTLEGINWLRLRVVDKRWTPDRGDKGGFIQEATGWKPSALQAVLDCKQAAAAAGLPLPERRS